MKFIDKNIYIIDEDANKELIATKVFFADKIIPRLLGLMFRKELIEGHAVLLHPCNSIHTFFMRFSIDVIYLDENFNVVKVRKNIKPWNVDLGHKKAKHVIELPVNTLKNNVEKVMFH